MFVVQLLLPLRDNQGIPFRDDTMSAIREELVGRFGGVTAFTRTPALGIWSARGEHVHDDIILVEVMTPELDRAWWHALRTRLEKTLKQDSIVIRAHQAELL